MIAADDSYIPGGYAYYLLLNDCQYCNFNGIAPYGGITTGIYITGNSLANSLSDWTWSYPYAGITIDSGSNWNCLKNFTTAGTIGVSDSGTNNRSNPNN
jgi:hypothetical protein